MLGLSCCACAHIEKTKECFSIDVRLSNALSFNLLLCVNVTIISEKHGAAVLRLERENDLLRQRLDAFATTPAAHASSSSFPHGSCSSSSSPSSSSSGSSSSSSGSEWVLDPGAAAARLQQAESEVGELRQEVAQLRQAALNQSRAWEAQLRTATAQAAAAEAEATTAQEKAKQLASDLAAATPAHEVEALRRQLRALQKAEFHAEDDSEDEAKDYNKEGTSAKGKSSSDRDSQKRADAALSAVMTSELEDDASPETTSTVEKLLMVGEREKRDCYEEIGLHTKGKGIRVKHSNPSTSQLFSSIRNSCDAFSVQLLTTSGHSCFFRCGSDALKICKWPLGGRLMRANSGQWSWPISSQKRKNRRKNATNWLVC